MASRFLAPAFSFGQPTARTPAVDPFRLLNRGMDSLLADVARVVGADTRESGGMLPNPRIDIEDTDNEIRITAEVPGVPESDVHVTLEDNFLILSGEKKQERQAKEGDMCVVERAFGRFRRAVQLPFAPNPESVDARYKDGILAISIPKGSEQRQKMREIEVKRDDGGSGKQTSIGDDSATRKSGTGSSGTESAGKQREEAEASAG